MPYSYDDIDLLISRAHRRAENQENLEEHQGKNLKVPRPIAIFALPPTGTDWRGVTVEEIRNRIMMLNAKKQIKVVVNQIFSKDLTIQRNNALKKTMPTFKQSK